MCHQRVSSMESSWGDLEMDKRRLSNFSIPLPLSTSCQIQIIKLIIYLLNVESLSTQHANKINDLFMVTESIVRL